MMPPSQCCDSAGYFCRAVFAFSTELLRAAGSKQQDSSTPSSSNGSSLADGQPYVLQATGRYAHSPTYLHQVAAATGWRVLLLQEAQIRQNAGQPIWGSLCLLQRLHNEM